MNLTACATALAVWTLATSRSIQAMDERPPPPPPEPVEPPPLPVQPPAPTSAPGPTLFGSVPTDTTVVKVGNVTVVDVGVSARSLREELATQRAEASKNKEKLVLMTHSDRCQPCADFSASLTDPLMQAALENVRLVRVHVKVFRDDLVELHVPIEAIPGFFLPAVDLTPRDGIDGGEWDEDVPKNIAPVMSAFVQEKYKVRRRPFRAPPGRGVRL